MKRLQDLDCGAFGYYQMICVYNDCDRLIGVYFENDLMKDTNLISQLSEAEIVALEDETVSERTAL